MQYHGFCVLYEQNFYLMFFRNVIHVVIGSSDIITGYISTNMYLFKVNNRNSTVEKGVKYIQN